MKIWKIIAVITIAKFCKSSIGLMVESRLVTNIGDEVELEAASQTNKHDTDALIGKKKFDFSDANDLLGVDAPGDKT